MYVFDLLSEMIKEKGLDKYLEFKMLTGIGRGLNYPPEKLLMMITYLKMCAHNLKFTNLLIKGGKSFDDKLKGSY